MNLERELVLVGDPTTSMGLTLPPGGVPTLIQGRPPALIGGLATCLACKGVGLIQKTGGPRRMLHHGQEVALHNDMVRCLCPVPPRLVATQHACRYDDGGA